MIKTIEAIVDESGNVRLLTKVKLPENRRAIVTILDERPFISEPEEIRPPKRSRVSDSEVLSVWADRPETSQEIATTIRRQNRNRK